MKDLPPVSEEQHSEEDLDSEWDDFNRLMTEYKLRHSKMHPPSPLLGLEYSSRRKVQEQASFYPCPPPAMEEDKDEPFDYISTAVRMPETWRLCWKKHSCPIRRGDGYNWLPCWNSFSRIKGTSKAIQELRFSILPPNSFNAFSVKNKSFFLFHPSLLLRFFFFWFFNQQKYFPDSDNFSFIQWKLTPFLPVTCQDEDAEDPAAIDLESRLLSSFL